MKPTELSNSVGFFMAIDASNPAGFAQLASLLIDLRCEESIYCEMANRKC